MNKTESPKIAVIGIGGVGGYLSAMLARTYDSVTVVARGEKAQAIRSKGLVLHSDLNGEILAQPKAVLEKTSDLEPQDVIFVCVKNYSLKELLPDLSEVVAGHTIICPVMNGTDPADRIRDAVSGGTVVKSLIYIVSYALADHSIRQ